MLLFQHSRCLQIPKTPPQIKSPPSPPHTTPTDFWNLMQKHPGFSMWKPCAQLMFQMAMDCDPEGKDRYLQCCFSGGSFVGGSSDPALRSTRHTLARCIGRLVLKASTILETRCSCAFQHKSQFYLVQFSTTRFVQKRFCVICTA